MDKILTNIKYGWCDFNLGDFNGRPSYIRFLPLDILNAYKEYTQSQHCIIEFDEETTQFCLVIYNWDDKVVILDNRMEKHTATFLDFDGEEVLNELVNEIISDIDTWAKWISIHDTEESIQKAKDCIIKRIKDVGLEYNE